MRGRDIKAVGELAGEASHVVTTLVRDMHAGIAGRVFGAIGALSKPTQIIHDGIAGTVYCAVDHGLRGGALAGGVLASQVWGRDDDAGLDSRARVGEALAAVNGIYGHRLASHRNGLALTMQIRQHGSVVPLCEGSVSAAFPEATGRVAVFVHGWCSTERLWWWPPCEDDARCYGQRLAEDLGFTPIYLRYNTGLHISQNGHLLAGMLERLRLLWPVPIDELVLVGHSMGGLVARSAGYYGMQQHHRWTAAVRHVVCLGSPHLGADLEKGVNVAAWALARLPETRALAGFLNRRSPGVKDLRFGAVIEEDWRDGDPDEFLRDRCHEVPFLPSAAYHFVAATVVPSALGRLVGDCLVRSYSATGTGRSRHIPFDADHGLTLTGLHHMDLLNHPQIYAKLREWLAATPQQIAAAR
jgi:pimeloyl-ACP methyl ester carboxylesterase